MCCLLIVVVVVVSNACSDMGCVWPQVNETNWQPEVRAHRRRPDTEASAEHTPN